MTITYGDNTNFVLRYPWNSHGQIILPKSPSDMPFCARQTMLLSFQKVNDFSFKMKQNLFIYVHKTMNKKPG
jgi:hypothetical protein